jgi:hypothetical protein
MLAHNLSIKFPFEAAAERTTTDPAVQRDIAEVRRQQPPQQDHQTPFPSTGSTYLGPAICQLS